MRSCSGNLFSSNWPQLLLSLISVEWKFVYHRKILYRRYVVYETVHETSQYIISYFYIPHIGLYYIYKPIILYFEGSDTTQNLFKKSLESFQRKSLKDWNIWEVTLYIHADHHLPIKGLCGIRKCRSYSGNSLTTWILMFGYDEKLRSFLRDIPGIEMRCYIAEDQCRESYELLLEHIYWDNYLMINDTK